MIFKNRIWKSNVIVVSKIDENRLNKHWRVNLDFGRAGSLSLQLYCTFRGLLHM